MGELTDDHHHDDFWEAGAKAAIRKDWERDVQAAHDENIRELEQRERYAVETDRFIDTHGNHACGDEESDNTPKLGKISPDEAVILMKNMRLGATASGEEYNSKFLARIREILRRLDMPA